MSWFPSTWKWCVSVAMSYSGPVNALKSLAGRMKLSWYSNVLFQRIASWTLWKGYFSYHRQALSVEMYTAAPLTLALFFTNDTFAFRSRKKTFRLVIFVINLCALIFWYCSAHNCACSLMGGNSVRSKTLRGGLLSREKIEKSWMKILCLIFVVYSSVRMVTGRYVFHFVQLRLKCIACNAAGPKPGSIGLAAQPHKTRSAKRFYKQSVTWRTELVRA